MAATGFTLVELVVVVAILAALVAMLVPTLQAAYKHTRFTICKHQLKQWGNAFYLYAGSNDGFFPHIDGLDRDKGPADRFGWVDVIPPLIGREAWRDHPIYERPAEGTFFQCPAAELVGENEYSYQPRRSGFFSYAMNSCLELDEDCYRPHGGGDRLPSFLHKDLIQRPSRVVLLFDQLLDPTRGYGGAAWNRSAGKYCGSYPKDFAVSHDRGVAGKGGSILYCDTTVRWAETVWKDDWPADLDAPPRDDRDWYPYPPK
jgi:prepilin-type N-terminal cleavage/methylation domain-containing protein